MKNKLSVIDFFCGAGGFSEGFRQMGFDIVKGFDFWKPAIDTYNFNFNNNSELKNILDFKNIHEIEALPNTDVIIGSPPCVSFSSSNKSGKADKTLGLDLTKCFLRIVAVKKHQKKSILRAWYMENVANSKKYVNKIYSFNDLELNDWAIKNNIDPNSEALNLKDNTTIINSADYGSYQARKRAISGEIIDQSKLVIPKQTHDNDRENEFLKPWNTLGKLLKELPKPNSETSDRFIKDPCYNSQKIKCSELTDHFYDSGLYKSEWRQSKELKTNHYCMGKMSFPENLDKPSRTITATKSGTSREALIYKSEYKRDGNGAYRNPTIREASSIMGFPLTYQFLGSINSKWRLVGNAVCPSVSRALAKEVLLDMNIEIPNIHVNKTINLNIDCNLNNFSQKEFNKQPRRTKAARFRRHPIKQGNITVTLSNYNIDKNSKTENKWFTSIQYGTGINFKNQEVEKDYYKTMEPHLLKIKGGSDFINIVNNGFSEKIGNARELQLMYENQNSNSGLLEPTELIEVLGEIINKINIENETYVQSKHFIFKFKKEIPTKQLFALYAVNKIASMT